MKSAKIVNGEIVDVVQGLTPDGYIEVIKDWSYPKEYPVGFYVKTTTKPILTVVRDEPHEDWVFVPKSINDVKTYIYSVLEHLREKRKLGTFDVGGEAVTITNKEDILNISALGSESSNYKLKKGRRIKGKGKIALLKKATEDYVQSAYDWESAQIDLVEPMVSHDELSDFFKSL